MCLRALGLFVDIWDGASEDHEIQHLVSWVTEFFSHRHLGHRQLDINTSIMHSSALVSNTLNTHGMTHILKQDASIPCVHTKRHGAT